MPKKERKYDGPEESVVQTQMTRRCRSVRLMKNKKRYECGYLAQGADGKEYFTRELEVGTYPEAEEWLNETAA